jgi:hypothetical protein
MGFVARSIAVVAAVGVVLSMGTPAMAAPTVPNARSCVSPHCYSRAVDYHSKINGARVTIQHSWFSMLPNTTPGYETPVIDRRCIGGDPCPWSISRQIWLGGRGGWVEVGLRNGFQSTRWKFADGRSGCGCQAYYQYWEDGPGDAYTHTHLIANISPDDSWHQYRIERTGDKRFAVLIDGRTVGVATASGKNFMGVSAIGSETNALSTVQPLSYMNRGCQTGWAVRDSSNVWWSVLKPNHGVRGGKDGSGSPDQTYFGGWTDAQLCIGKGGL